MNEWAVGEYHSAYDDFYWMNKFGADNRTYDMYVCLAQFTGTLLLDLSQSSRGLDMNATAVELISYTTLLAKQGSSLNVASLAEAVNEFAAVLQSGTFSVDTTLQLERQFLWPEGLPERPFYRHLLQAPGINLGYGAVTLPGVTQAIVDGNMTQASEQLDHVVQVVVQATHFLQQANRNCVEIVGRPKGTK